LTFTLDLGSAEMLVKV